MNVGAARARVCARTRPGALAAHRPTGDAPTPAGVLRSPLGLRHHARYAGQAIGAGRDATAAIRPAGRTSFPYPHGRGPGRVAPRGAVPGRHRAGGGRGGLAPARARGMESSSPHRAYPRPSCARPCARFAASSVAGEVPLDGHDPEVLPGSTSTQATLDQRQLGEIVHTCVNALAEERARAVRGHLEGFDVAELMALYQIETCISVHETL